MDAQTNRSKTNTSRDDDSSREALLSKEAKRLNASTARYPVRGHNRVKHYSNTSENLDGTEGFFADVMHDINHAEKVIFIAGWLFEPQFYFPRKHSNDSKTLGTILIEKAIEKPEMEIAILVWNQTWGPEPHKTAIKYLEELAKEKGLKGLPQNFQIRQVNRTGVLWSHHQKFIIVDTPTAAPDKRELTVFYGSADLAGYKFETHHHHFIDVSENKFALTNVFEEGGCYRSKFPVFHVENVLPPRFPWREISSRVKGPVSEDFLTEFVSRWCAGSQGALSGFEGSADRAGRVLKFYKKVAREKLFTPADDSKDDPSIWDAQLVTSIESDCHVAWGSKKPFDKSIQEAYLNAIQHAENFIYIENQFFTGLPDSENQIPAALVKKIIERNKKDKPFHVFVILPMLPGDAPGDSRIESMRYVQWQTMRWMMEAIEKETGKFWGHFLTFGFFGKWLKRVAEYKRKYNNPETSLAELQLYAGHTHVYIHSKLMIADDLYVLNGSANLNERSVAGPYDTEANVYQQPMSGFEEQCRAETRAFRVKIWRDYFGEACCKALDEKGLDNPHLPENVKIIQSRARQNLTRFLDGSEGDSPESGLLLTWPFKQEKGCVGQYESDELQYLPETTPERRKYNCYRWFPSAQNDSKPKLLAFANFCGHKGFR